MPKVDVWGQNLGAHIRSLIIDPGSAVMSLKKYD